MVESVSMLKKNNKQIFMIKEIFRFRGKTDPAHIVKHSVWDMFSLFTKSVWPRSQEYCIRKSGGGSEAANPHAQVKHYNQWAKC